MLFRSELSSFQEILAYRSTVAEGDHPFLSSLSYSRQPSMLKITRAHMYNSISLHGNYTLRRTSQRGWITKGEEPSSYFVLNEETHSDDNLFRIKFLTIGCEGNHFLLTLIEDTEFDNLFRIKFKIKLALSCLQLP